MGTRIQDRRDTAVNWALTNPILLAGERGVDTTNRLFKIGDGENTWEDLEEFNPSSMVYMGQWDPASNAYPVSPEKGWYYVCLQDGVTNYVQYRTNDWIVYNGMWWDKIDNYNIGDHGSSHAGAGSDLIPLAAAPAFPFQGASGLMSKYDKQKLDAIIGTSVSDSVLTITSAMYTLPDDVNLMVLADATSNNIELGLPTPRSGTMVKVKKVDSTSHTVTIIPTAFEFGPAYIDGEANYILEYDQEFVFIQCDGTIWFVVGE